MSEDKTSSAIFESDDPAEQKLWSKLGDLPRSEPSAELRRSFYKELERATAAHWSELIQSWLGLRNKRGWLTIAACALAGVGVGQIQNQSTESELFRLAVLEENIAMLNRELILDHMQDAAAGQRLRGVIDAEYIVQGDLEIVQALLVRATEDSVYSVRSAAISALGPSLATAAVERELKNLLENSDSPLVQLALVDLLLRNGSNAQLEYLLGLANAEKLHPDLIDHVRNALKGETV